MAAISTRLSLPRIDPSLSALLASRGLCIAASIIFGLAALSAQPVDAATTGAQPSDPSQSTRPPSHVPPGMVWIPGGEFWMGADEFADAQPWHRVVVDGFWMDKTEVTNDQFATFVKETGYVTLAERMPNAEDFPGAPAENLVAGSIVFTPPRIR
jgi:formylglycine-generating enzyme required for sulfatase activity